MPLAFRSLICTMIFTTGLFVFTSVATLAGPKGPNFSPSIGPISPHMAPSIHFPQPQRSQSLDRVEREHKKKGKKSIRAKKKIDINNQALPGKAAAHDNPALSSQEASQAVGALNNLQQLRDAQKAHNLFGRGNPAVDPAAGTALGGHTPGLDQNGNDANNAPNPASWTRDCLADPAKCLSSNSQGASGPGTTSGPPTAIPGGLDRSGIASEEHNDSPHSDSNNRGGGDPPPVQWTEDDGTEVTVTQNSDGSRVDRHTEDENGTYHETTWRNSDGEEQGTAKLIITSFGAKRLIVTRASDGRTWTIDYNRQGQEINRRETTRGPDSQPGVDDSTAKADPCGWTPWGCRNKPDIRKSIKQMTSQPAQGESADTGTGSGAPNVGPEAVTNPGEVERGGTGHGGRPLDMRDPVPRGPEGVPPPPHN